MIRRLATGAVLAIAVGAVAVPRARSNVAPGVSPASAPRCEVCHRDEARQWQHSRHAHAWTDPVFQSELAHGRPAWCVGCHAPLAPDPAAADDRDPRVSAGVTCDACHRRGEDFVSSRRSSLSPHATVVDPQFGSAQDCARCHEFNFPILGERGRLVRYTDEPMQATVSQARGAECADCHDPHAATGSHDAAYVASALAVDICMRGRKLVVSVTNTGAAHNVPSGGVHRRIVVRAWRSSAPERLAEIALGRTFELLASGGKRTTSDTTLAPNETRHMPFDVRALGGSAREPLNVELRYVYALDEHATFPPGTDVSKVLWQQRLELSALGTCAPTREPTKTHRIH